MFYFGQRFWDIAPTQQSRARGYGYAGLLPRGVCCSRSCRSCVAARERRARPRSDKGCCHHGGRGQARRTAREQRQQRQHGAAESQRVRGASVRGQIQAAATTVARASAPNRAEITRKTRFYTLCVVFIRILCKKTIKNVTLFSKIRKSAKPA